MEKAGILEHRELLNKWLDGESIQFYYEPEKTWINVDNPSWDKDIKYRIKPHRIGFEGCEFNEIEYKVDKIGKVVEVRVDKIKINNNRTKSTLFQDKKIAEAYAVLPQLIRLRDEYNEGWKPDYKYSDSKFGIYNFKDDLSLFESCYASRILIFKTAEIRNNFLKDHKDLLEIAKPFL